MSDPGAPADLLRFRRFRDPEGTVIVIPRSDVWARYLARDLDLEDELFIDRTQTWKPLWKVKGTNLREGWLLLLSERQLELGAWKALVQRGELSYTAYIERREQQLRQVRAGAALTRVHSGASRGGPGAAKDLLASRLGDRFIYEREIGEGGGGSVSLWTHFHTGATVAVKITKPQVKDHIRNEVRQLEAIRSPNVVHVRDYGPIDAHGEQWFIVFDYVPGPTLAEYIRREHAVGRLQPDTIMHVLLGIAQGLADLHRAGIVHRDLNPANIILKPAANGKLTPVLIDLGLARSGAHTGQSVIGGTSGYQSPEQQEGRACSPASDIFCFGLLAYELVTGKRLAGGRLRVLHEECPGLPRRLDALVKERCADSQIDDRLQDGTALLEALSRVGQPAPTAEAQGTPLGEQASVAPIQAHSSVDNTPQSSLDARSPTSPRAAPHVSPTELEQGFESQAEHVAATNKQAWTLIRERMNEGDLQRAAELYHWSADQGNAEGMLGLGWCYATGTGVPRDGTEALGLFKQAADRGLVEGMHDCGCCLVRGIDVPTDVGLGVSMLEDAANRGFAPSIAMLGWCHEQGCCGARDARRAIDFYQRAADLGHDQAMNDLAAIRLDGIQDDRSVVDQAEAVKWFRKSAERGNPYAMRNLAVCFAAGLGTARSPRLARLWMTRLQKLLADREMRAIDDSASVGELRH